MVWPDVRKGSGQSTDQHDNSVSVEVQASTVETASVGTMLEAAETALWAALVTAGYKDVQSAMNTWYKTRAMENEEGF